MQVEVGGERQRLDHMAGPVTAGCPGPSGCGLLKETPWRRGGGELSPPPVAVAFSAASNGGALQRSLSPPDCGRPTRRTVPSCRSLINDLWVGSLVAKDILSAASHGYQEGAISEYNQYRSSLAKAISFIVVTSISPHLPVTRFGVTIRHRWIHCNVPGHIILLLQPLGYNCRSVFESSKIQNSVHSIPSNDMTQSLSLSQDRHP